MTDGWAALADERSLPVIYFLLPLLLPFSLTRYLKTHFQRRTVQTRSSMTSVFGRVPTGSGPKVKSVMCHSSPTVIQAGVVRLFCMKRWGNGGREARAHNAAVHWETFPTAARGGLFVSASASKCAKKEKEKKMLKNKGSFEEVM